MSAQDFHHLEVGDAVILRDRNEVRRHGGPKETRVTRVGRLYFYIAAHKSPFCRKDGRAHDAYGHAWIETSEQQEAHKKRTDAWSVLRNAGLEKRMGEPVSDDLLFAIAETIARVKREKGNG